METQKTNTRHLTPTESIEPDREKQTLKQRTQRKAQDPDEGRIK